jgi:hypothetical protein
MKSARVRKWAKLAVIVAVFATLLLLSQPLQYHIASGQGYGYGGGGGGPSTTGGGVSGLTTSGGEFTEAVTFESEGGDLTISIPEGTIGKTKDGDPLPEIRITKDLTPPSPPEDADFVGFPYDLEPDGATFEPAITLTFTYDPSKLPSGVGPQSLTIGYYDTDTKTWVPLDAKDLTIDPETNTITAKISHFTHFGVLAGTAPAEITVSGLVVPATEIGIAEQTTISVMVGNTGDVAGTAKVTLKINGVTVASKDVKVAGHESKSVSFNTIQGKAGSYSVDVNGLTGAFTVKSAPVTPALITSTVPSITVPPVTTAAPTAPAPPAVPAPVPEPTPWAAIIISLVATIVVAVIIVWYYGFRTQY